MLSSADEGAFTRENALSRVGTTQKCSKEQKRAPDEKCPFGI